MDLCKEADAKAFIGLTGTADVEDFVERASLIFEQECNRYFKEAMYTEVLSGHGEKEMYVSHPYLHDFTGSTALIAEEWDWSLDAWSALDDDDKIRYDDPDGVGLLVWDRCFPRGTQNLRLTYPGGVAATTSKVPEDIVQAVIELTHVLWERQESKIHIAPEVVLLDSGAAQRFSDRDIPLTVKRVINRYRLKV